MIKQQILSEWFHRGSRHLRTNCFLVARAVASEDKLQFMVSRYYKTKTPLTKSIFEAHWCNEVAFWNYKLKEATGEVSVHTAT